MLTITVRPSHGAPDRSPPFPTCPPRAVLDIPRTSRDVALSEQQGSLDELAAGHGGAGPAVGRLDGVPARRAVVRPEVFGRPVFPLQRCVILQSYN